MLENTFESERDLPALLCHAVQSSLDDALAQVERLLAMGEGSIDPKAGVRFRLVRSHLWQVQDVLKGKLA
jgi:hypothetical protein